MARDETRRLRWALLLLMACGGGTTEEIADPRAMAREGLLAEGASCFEDERDYCIDDEALLDAVLDQHVARFFGGRFPTDRAGIERLIRRARGSYANAQLETPENRAKVEAKIRERFDHPTIEVEGDLVKADLGVVPTGMVPARVGWTMNTESPLLERRALHTREVAGKLIYLRGLHPHAKTIALRVQLPRSPPVVFYVWYLDRDQVAVIDAGDRWVTTTALGPTLTPLVNGALSLRQGLHTCSVEESSMDPRCPTTWPTF